MTPEAGALLLATDKGIGLIGWFADCFHYERGAELVEHSVPSLIGHRVFAIAFGYENLVDHYELRSDPVLVGGVGQAGGEARRLRPLTGKSTLGRLDHPPEGAATRYHL